jgi:Cu-processing system permease protein
VDLNGMIQFGLLGGIGTILTIIFSGLAFLIALNNENRIKGFGLAILVWLFFAIIYDGLFLLLLSLYSDYPLENAALVGIMLNPIDLSRVLILLRLDISALMGYTGAVFQKFFGAGLGSTLAIISLFMWMMVPVYGILYSCKRKDF